MSRLTVVKNAFANVCRGGASALVMLLLPPFLIRILHKDTYSTWLLITQLSTYVGFMDFGIQMAVGRYVAYYNELGEVKKRDSIISTSLAILIASATVAIIGISILAWQLPNLFKNMPLELYQEAQLALLFTGGSLAITLPFSVFGGIFIGLQRYDIPALIIGVSKLFGGLFVVIIAKTSHSIVMMSMVMGLTNVGSGIWQFLAYRKTTGNTHLNSKFISRSVAKEISYYCYGLSVWTVAMMLITGFDTVIVGYFDYKSVVYYTLAATLTNFVMGLQNSMTAAIMPLASTISAKQDSEALGYLLISGTKYGVIIMILIITPFMLWGKHFLGLWVGEAYANDTILILQLLLTGNFIRQIGGVYSTIALAVGEQSKIIMSPLIEGMINIFISVFATAYLGVIGVAIGTICSALIGIALHLIYNLPRTKSIKVESPVFLSQSVLSPSLSIIPIIVFMVLKSVIEMSVFEYITISLVLCLSSWIMLWNIGISDLERKDFLGIMNKLASKFF
jgi:O-antigen/teichoic acid export membrane protein